MSVLDIKFGSKATTRLLDAIWFICCLLKAKKNRTLFKTGPISFVGQATDLSKLKKVNLTFDAQNMPKSACYKIISGLV